MTYSEGMVCDVEVMLCMVGVRSCMVEARLCMVGNAMYGVFKLCAVKV